jgi:3-oxoacyl-[acyl-carrier protein] reductase
MLKGKIILITGASRGIGKAFAILAAKNNASVIINYKNNDGESEKTLLEVKKYSADSIRIKADVSDENQVKEMFKQIREKYKRLDVLVNNAGILKRSLLMLAKPKDIDEMININIKGTINCSRQAIKIMIAQKYGKVINTSSIVGTNGDLGMTAYSLTKGAIVSFTKSLAKEVGSFNVQVNAVAPGIIDTDMTKGMDDTLKKSVVEKIALARIGNPDDVAKVILFLSSELSDYVSGQVIGVDGCQIM